MAKYPDWEEDAKLEESYQKDQIVIQFDLKELRKTIAAGYGHPPIPWALKLYWGRN